MATRMSRRSNASPSEPPVSAPMISGTSWARLTSPTWSEDRVSEYTWNGIATAVSWLAKTSTNCPANSSRKPRDSRSGPRSIRIRFATGPSCLAVWVAGPLPRVAWCLHAV